MSMSIPINVLYPTLYKMSAKDRRNLEDCAYTLMVTLTTSETDRCTEADAYELLYKLGLGLVDPDKNRRNKK